MQEVAIFRQIAADFQLSWSHVLKISIFLLNFLKMGSFRAWILDFRAENFRERKKNSTIFPQPKIQERGNCPLLPLPTYHDAADFCHWHLRSNFPIGYRKMRVLWSRLRNGCSRSSKVIDLDKMVQICHKMRFARALSWGKVVEGVRSLISTGLSTVWRWHSNWRQSTVINLKRVCMRKLLLLLFI